ncbi:hypothetical protein H4R24_000749 [Coemansia sp. RSA 988]|nr:hypothetical protein H4R24_000749 [Coemansia sp. RSA 988]
MSELTEKDLALGKRLAHVDKSVRDQAVAAIGQVLEQSGELTHAELLRHWKALFYCFWLSDKPLVQQELSLSLASLTLACKDNNSVGFVRTFWETLCREWFDVDKHRVDKYLLLARRMVFFGFQSMKQSSWDMQVVESFLGAYQEGPINPSEQRIPNSIRSHIADVYVDELVRLAGDIRNTHNAPDDEISKIPVAMLLEPFMRLIGTSSIRQMPAIVQASVFENIVVRIAEAEERGNDQDGCSDGEFDTINNNGVTDNQIVNESLGDVQFLADSIPEIKQRLLSVGGEKSTTPSGRKRLHMLYQALCDTFPDEESDIVFPKQIVVKTPIGAEKRKLLDKRRRKRAGKERDLKEVRKSKTRLAQNKIAVPAAGLEANALEGVATVEDERKFQEDIVKIRAMEKRAGFGTTEDSGDSNSAQPASKKAKRKEKQNQLNSARKEDKIAGHASSYAADSPTASVPNKTANDEQCGQQQGMWVVRSTSKTPTIASNKKHQQPGELDSRLAQFEKTVIIRDKSVADSSEQVKGAQTTPSSHSVAGGSLTVSGRKRQSWAMERNSVKRFLKKVPMLPSLEPVLMPEAQDVQLKPILRKRSAYKSEPVNLQSLPKPLKSQLAKRRNQTHIGRHPISLFNGKPSIGIKVLLDHQTQAGNTY